MELLTVQVFQVDSFCYQEQKIKKEDDIVIGWISISLS